MSKIPSMQELLEAGVHFGHQTRRWNPKMSPYIFTAREGIHVIDLGLTVEKLEEAYQKVKEIAASGGKVLFVASKRQAKEIIEEQAKRAGTYYISERWVGGLLTNWEQTESNIKKLNGLKEKMATGQFKNLTKKERLLIDKKIAKLERLYQGVSSMEELPQALFVVDVKKEENACREANKKGIPVIAIADTNANLSLVDYPIPGNDDANRAISIVVEAIADAYLEGKKALGKKEEEAAKEEKTKTNEVKQDG